MPAADPGNDRSRFGLGLAGPIVRRRSGRGAARCLKAIRPLKTVILLSSGKTTGDSSLAFEADTQSQHMTTQEQLQIQFSGLSR